MIGANEEFSFNEKLWIWDGPNPWYFITIPIKISTDLRKRYKDVHRGWGSLPVEVFIGKSNWKTSIFWEKRGSYLLPVKKLIRKAEQITNGDKVKVKIIIKA